MKTQSSPNDSTTRWFVVLGVIVLIGSFLVTMMAAAPPTPTQATGGSEKKTKEERRAVAVAFVDVEGGVRTLYPTRPGRVVELPFAEGVLVKAGQVLLRVDDTLARHERDEATLALEAAKLRMSSVTHLAERHNKQIEAMREAVNVQRAEQKEAEAGLSKARTYLRERLGGSTEDVAILEAKVEKAKAGVRAKELELNAVEAVDAQDAVRQARQDVRAKEKLLEKATFAVEECAIKAPMDGTLLRSLVNVGEVLGPNPQRPALWFCPAGPRIVRAEVEQEFATRIELGQMATIRDDATGHGTWKGKVTRVSDWYTHRRSILLEPMQFNDVRTLEVILSVEQDSRQPLRIGQRVLVTLD